ncbi:hypothetical protein [Marinomonas balearica]|uniref:Uncharacterized protein n=1 Tax=Marinomonas balearica TaxID=491947 RepID=A0A4V3CH21_9GAMM|nr:hypothetical protein [Marinomonas balearica]TDO99922.1 hypothetical protein DFP79_0933 [Marinomonas balearica]
MKNGLNLVTTRRLITIILFSTVSYSYADTAVPSNKAFHKEVIITPQTSQNLGSPAQSFHIANAHQHRLMGKLMAKNRLSEHMKEQKFIDALNTIGAQDWTYYVHRSSKI